jgi:putative phosphoesterase
MKVVILSDIHGNLEALAGLPETFDELWVLGDLVNYGPNPAEVIEFVRANGSVIVRGNHDHAIGSGDDPRCSPPFREMADATTQYTNSVLSDSQKQFLRDLPLVARREVDGLQVYLCHAAPSDPLFAYYSPDSPRWEQEFAHAGADLLLVGHTHLQYVSKIGAHKILNPGSLGQSKMGSPAAYYAVLNNGVVGLRSFDYPFEKTIQKIAALPIPAGIRASLAAVLRHGGIIYRDLPPAPR